MRHIAVFSFPVIIIKPETTDTNNESGSRIVNLRRPSAAIADNEASLMNRLIKEWGNNWARIIPSVNIPIFHITDSFRVANARL
ncbi:hypothetical protein D3C77_638530 [compost metagenome]